MPKIEHIAIRTPDLKRSRRFYEKYFDAKAGPVYHNPDKNFSSYFLEFETGARLELMHQPAGNPSVKVDQENPRGYAHLAISVGSEEAVNNLTEKLRTDGYRVKGEPRRTGDGYWESVVLDPDENLLEITA